MEHDDKVALKEILLGLEERGWVAKTLDNGGDCDIDVITLEKAVEDATAVEIATFYFYNAVGKRRASMGVLWGNDYGELIYDHSSGNGFEADIEAVLQLVFGIENDEEAYFNTASSLPPVDCPLLILYKNHTLPVKRHAFITNKDGAVTYITTYGREIVGRFPWTYP